MVVAAVIRLEAWIEENKIDPAMLWKNSASYQAAYLLLMQEWMRLQDKDTTTSVVSTHRSKSIDLPVVEFAMPGIGLHLTCRDNFYNWGFTIKADVPLGWFKHDGFKFGEHPVYYEGFARAGVPVYTHTPEYHKHAEFSFKLVGVEPLEVLPRLIRAVRDGESHLRNLVRERDVADRNACGCDNRRTNLRTQ